MAAAVSFSRRIHILMLLYYYSIWSLHPPRATSHSFSFNFSQPGGYDAQDFSFEGDAYYDSQSRRIELTKGGGSPNIQNSVGRALHAQPVPLWDVDTGELTRFTTSFTFRIKVNGPVSGDGLAFFLGHYPPTSIPDPLDNGKNLGLFNRNVSTVATGDERAVAVEFDTFLNPGIDTSGSHMGIDVNSIISRAYTNVTVHGKNLTAGLPMTCHISYGNDTKILAAVLQIGDVTYHVNTSVDLRQLLPNVVSIGFSGATGVAVELHQIMSWSFNSTLDPSPARKILWKQIAVVTGPIIGVIAIVCSFVGVRRWQLCTRKKPYKALANGRKHIGYHKLARATKKFAEENKLGQGGSAFVYRGLLKGSQVAIKRFKLVPSGEGRKAFEDELMIASRLRHKNLVKLIGWCYDGQRNLVEFICWWWDERYTRLFLVYELLQEGSLDRHLHGGNSLLPWSKRHEIILNLGSALQYLHVDCEQDQQCIVHGDIKSSNILLGSSFVAKLGDFGLARFVHHETGSQTTNVVQGTFGYIDPVFIDTSKRNRESDIYSFGIVLLEMVSGRNPTDQDMPPLSTWVWSKYNGNVILEAVDERLMNGQSTNGLQQMKHALLIGLLCAHQDPSNRPSITDAMNALGSDSEELTLDITPLEAVTH
ncbi:hypothetical protein CFC21_049939 [Triticum aestivum]|uniref:non-specific serine/threonine protein kinase n=2 Tax=Triticum aestivum TaxID=4565 RepID=A0A9R1G3W7_WHEAT|nr:L-type lectin-domain containing receptor kinase IX.1-like [Triticum aestivum]KAF7040004.1 hypothetical protein CFC21_049939 [Triticum aestivum]